MKRLTLVLLAALLLWGCQARPAPTDSPYITFCDSEGAQVSLPQKPQTVAVLFSSYAQIWRLSGGSVDITVGESVERGFATQNAVLVDEGAGKTVDVEALIAAQPQLVIGSADIGAQVDACRALRSAGIPTALFRVDTLEDYLTVLDIFCRINENPQAYDQYGAQVKAQVDRVLRTEREATPRILFIRSGSSAKATKAKTAPENFVCTMLQQLGAYNIADDAPILLDGLSLEHIIQCDPDYIFISPMGSEEAARAYIGQLFSQPGWAELTAVREGRWSFLDKELFHFKPNHRWAEAYGQLAQLLYGEDS